MARGWPLFWSPVRGERLRAPRCPKGVPQKAREIPHETTSRHRSPKKSRPMNATEIAATLSVRAEDVCRRYLPRGRKQGRYWTVGDTSGAKGRSLFVRLAPPGIPEKWTDAATNKHGDLLDLIRLHTGGASLRHAMEEALAFLSLPPSTPAPMATRRRLWGVASMAPCGSSTPAPSAIAASRPCGFIPPRTASTSRPGRRRHRR